MVWDWLAYAYFLHTHACTKNKQQHTLYVLYIPMQRFYTCVVGVVHLFATALYWTDGPYFSHILSSKPELFQTC